MGSKIIEIKKDWIREIAQNLENQIIQTILEMGEDARDSFSLNPYSLGYLFGFCNGGFKYHHIDRDLEKVRTLIEIYIQVFGEAGHDILQTTLSLNNDEDLQFKEGNDSGHEESLRWFHRQENPIGLLRYVLNGEKTKSLNPLTPHHYWTRSFYPLAG